MKALTNGFLAHLLLLALFISMASIPAFAGATKDCDSDKWRDHPICTGGGTDPDPEDPCANFAAPDYVFWRDSTSKRVPAVTVFLAESASHCEKELLRIDLSDSGSINTMRLAYSSVGVGEEFFGRIVFEREEWLDSSQAASVWKYDFGISGGEIQPVSGDPKMVLENIDSENHYVNGLDLSADTASLVWQFHQQNGDPWNLSISTINIDNCEIWPCAHFDGGQSLVQTVYDYLGDGVWVGTYLKNPVWGPYGDRIYFLAGEWQGTSNYQYIMAVESDGSDLGQAKTIFGIEIQPPDDPDYRVVRSVSSGLSGWPSPDEYLVVEIGEDSFAYSCAELYTLTVTNCEDEIPATVCELQYETQGGFPSWTKTGAILHTGLGNACKQNQIGLWDGTGLEALTKGWEPEAAGGE